MAREVRLATSGVVASEVNSLCLDVLHKIVSEEPATHLELRNRQVVRRPELLEAIRNLDASQDLKYQESLIEWIRDAYEQRYSGVLFALFARCYLGADFIDHQTTLAGSIVEHYSSQESVPAIFAKARSLAANPHYLYVEIYSDGEVIPVRHDGSCG